MINDPLLPPPPPPAPSSKATTAGARRAKHPAMSARILATGLAATGTLGLTAGYAVGARNVPGAQQFDSASTPAGQQGITELSPAQPQQPVQTQDAPSQAPRVIQVPVPGIAPANPGQPSGRASGSFQQQGPAQQQSSGSN